MNSLPSLFSLNNRIGLVTGAAGQLGRQFSFALAEAGANVITTDTDEKAAKKLADTLSNQFNKPMLGLKMDVTNRMAIKRALDSSIRKFDGIDILVNNAGIGIFTPFEKRTEQEINKTIDINSKGVLWVTHAVSQIMRKKRSGAIINIGSIYGVVSADPRIYGNSKRNSSEIYAMTKGGVIQFTRYMSMYLSKHKIRVNCISPGGIFNNQKKSFVKNYSDKTPLGRMGREDELKGALIYLASNASSYVTGHNLVVDGGFSVI